MLGVFPFAIHFILSGVTWDLNKENTMSVHDCMEISFHLEEKEEETADGEKVVAFFQKVRELAPFTALATRSASADLRRRWHRRSSASRSR